MVRRDRTPTARGRERTPRSGRRACESAVWRVPTREVEIDRVRSEGARRFERVERVIIDLRPADPETAHLAGAQHPPVQSTRHETGEAFPLRTAIDDEVRGSQIEEQTILEHRVVTDPVHDVLHTWVHEPAEVQDPRTGEVPEHAD